MSEPQRDCSGSGKAEADVSPQVLHNFILLWQQSSRPDGRATCHTQWTVYCRPFGEPLQRIAAAKLRQQPCLHFRIVASAGRRVSQPRSRHFLIPASSAGSPRSHR